MEKIVITGIGVYTPFGKIEETWKYFKNPKNNTLQEVLKIEKLDLSSVAKIRSIRRMDRLTQIALVALFDAFEDGGFNSADIDKERLGAIMGTTFGPVNTVSDYLKGLIDNGMNGANPSLFPNTVINSSLGQLSILFKFKGYNTMYVGSNPIDYACDVLLSDKSDVICVGGVDEHSAILEETFRAKGLFDKKISLAEGAAFIVLEKESHAKKRNAKKYCEVATCRSYTDYNYKDHLSSLDQEVLKKTISEVLERNEAPLDEVISFIYDVKKKAAPDFEVIKEITNGQFESIKWNEAFTKMGEAFSGSEVLGVVLGAKSIQSSASENVMVNSLNITGNTTSLLLRNYE